MEIVKEITNNTPLQDRDNNFNLLRLVFAILVLLAHSPELIDGNRSREILTNIFGTITFGEFAVQGFFLLSGYMIVKSWLHDPNLLKYLKKRIARIYPGFIIATLISIYLVGWLGATNRLTYFHDINYSKLFFNIFALVGPYTPEVFKGTAFPIVNGPMWTLSYEFRCYIMVAILGVYGVNKHRNIWFFGLITMLCLVLACTFFDIDKYHFPGSFYIFGVPSPLINMSSCFATGACYYLYRDKIKYNFYLFVFALAIFLISLSFHNTATLGFCVTGGYCIFFIAFKKIRLFKIFQNLPDVSYGIYLYGWPTQKLLLWYCPAMSPWLLFIVALSISTIVALCSWYIVESPVLQLISKRRAIAV